MTDKELMQRVLDALVNWDARGRLRLIETLRTRLAQPEPEELTGKEKIVYDILCSDETPPNGQHWEGFVAQKIVEALAQPEPNEIKWDASAPLVMNPHPAFAKSQREWIGLTDEEIQQIQISASSKLSAIYISEAQLKGKNA